MGETEKLCSCVIEDH